VTIYVLGGRLPGRIGSCILSQCGMTLFDSLP